MCVFECLLSFSIALYLMFMSLTELGAQGLSRLASQKLKGLPVSGPPVLEFQAQPAVPRSSRVFLSRVFLSLPPPPPPCWNYRLTLPCPGFLTVVLGSEFMSSAGMIALS